MNPKEHIAFWKKMASERIPPQEHLSQFITHFHLESKNKDAVLAQYSASAELAGDAGVAL